MDLQLGALCRAEACIVNYLCVHKPDKGGTAHSVILAGTFVNQDGRSSSLTAPNGPAQQLVIRGALAAADHQAQVSATRHACIRMQAQPECSAANLEQNASRR